MRPSIAECLTFEATKHPQTYGDEAGGVVTFVGAKREAALGARIMPPDHGERRFALRRPEACIASASTIRPCRFSADVAELRRRAVVLAVQLGSSGFWGAALKCCRLGHGV